MSGGGGGAYVVGPYTIVFIIPPPDVLFWLRRFINLIDSFPMYEDVIYVIRKSKNCSFTLYVASRCI